MIPNWEARVLALFFHFEISCSRAAIFSSDCKALVFQSSFDVATPGGLARQSDDTRRKSGDAVMCFTFVCEAKF